MYRLVNWGNGDFRRPERNMPTHACTSCTISTVTRSWGGGEVSRRHVLRSALSDGHTDCSAFCHKTAWLAWAVQPCHSHPHSQQLFSSFQRRVHLAGCNGGGRGVQTGVLLGNFTGWRSSPSSGVCSVGPPGFSVGFFWEWFHELIGLLARGLTRLGSGIVPNDRLNSPTSSLIVSNPKCFGWMTYCIRMEVT